jgi:hypothetical protein
MGIWKKASVIGATLGLGIAIAGCCGGGSKDSDKGGDKSSESASTGKVGERIKGPESDFSIVVEKGEIYESIGDTKPKIPAGAKWVVVRYKLKNEGKEPKGHLLEFKEILKDSSGTEAESSSDGSLAFTMSEPDAEDTTLDKLPVGTEIKQVAVFAVMPDKAKGEVSMVFEQAITLLGKPKRVTIPLTLTEHVSGGTKPKPASSKH